MVQNKKKVASVDSNRKIQLISYFLSANIGVSLGITANMNKLATPGEWIHLAAGFSMFFIAIFFLATVIAAMIFRLHTQMKQSNFFMAQGWKMTVNNLIIADGVAFITWTLLK